MKLNYNYQDDNGQYAPRVLAANGMQVINPTEQMYIDAGYHKVVTQPPTPAEPTAEEIAEANRLARIEELKTLLWKSDYKAIKFAEGWITPEDYADIKAQRQAWRVEINELESEE